MNSKNFFFGGRPNSIISANAPRKSAPNILQYAGMELVRDLLPMLDDFERALKVESGKPEYAKASR